MIGGASPTAVAVVASAVAMAVAADPSMQQQAAADPPAGAFTLPAAPSSTAAPRVAAVDAPAGTGIVQ